MEDRHVIIPDFNTLFNLQVTHTHTHTMVRAVCTQHYKSLQGSVLTRPGTCSCIIVFYLHTGLIIYGHLLLYHRRFIKYTAGLLFCL